MSIPRILHVLPHPGGGGEQYVNYLERIPRFHVERLYLTADRRPMETPAGLARLLRAAGSSDLIHIHGDSGSLVCLPALGRRPTVITLHGSHLLRRAGGVRGAIVRLGLRRAFERGHSVIAVSESEADLAREVAPKGRSRVILIHNGVPDPDPVTEGERRSVREQLGLSPGSVAALFVGELSDRKQPLQFAKAVRLARESHPEIVGLMAGDGPLRSAVESMQEEGLRLLGHRDDAERLLAAADVFVLPSRWEGLSLAILEAMALGKATVVSDGPGNPEAVGDAGLVVPVGDISGMATSLSRLAGNPSLRSELGQAASRRARTRFSLAAMLEATASVYDEALGTAPRSMTAGDQPG